MTPGAGRAKFFIKVGLWLYCKNGTFTAELNTVFSGLYCENGTFTAELISKHCTEIPTAQ